MRKPHYRTAAIALSAAISASLHAEEAVKLDTMVISAAGIEQKLTDAPASITVITREELDKKPYITLLDAVREVEGVDVGETTDKTGQGGISIRGMGADYTLILIDGKRQNNVGDIYPNNFGGNQFNHIPPKEMIERIEIIRGPASTLYGAEALGGVINIITKRNSTEWHGSVSHSRTFETNDDFGNDTTTDFAVSGPLIKGKLNLGVRGSLYERDASEPQYEDAIDPNGNIIPRALGFGGGGKTTENENHNLGFRLDFKPADNQNLSFDYETSEQTYDNTPRTIDGELSYPLGTRDNIESVLRASGGKVAPRVGYDSDQEFTRDQFSLRHEGDWAFGRSDITLHHVETANNGRTLPFTAAERLRLQQMYENNGNSFAGIEEQVEAEFLPRPKRTLETRQTTLDVKLDSQIGDHWLVYGGQYIDAEMEDGTFGMNGSNFTAGTVQEHKQWSLFAEDNWGITDAFTLTGGLRYDHHNIFGGNVSPRIYANWNLTPEWTLKGGVSTGYKAPKASDLYDGITGFGGQGTSPFHGTPDLQPEKSVSSELAIYYSHPEGHNFNATVFSNKFKDKIESGDGIYHCDDPAADSSNCANLAPEWNQVLGNGYTFSQLVNIDSAKIDGIELAGKYQFTPKLYLRANYTYTDARITSGVNEGQPLSGTAKHMANATLNWQATPQFSTYLTAEMRSDRFTSTPRGWPTDVDYPEFYKAYTMFHLGASYDVTKNFTVNARINNLLDEDFTTYQTVFTTEDGGASWDANYIDDYNVKAKSRNFWLSANYRF